MGPSRPHLGAEGHLGRLICNVGNSSTWTQSLSILYHGAQVDEEEEEEAAAAVAAAVGTASAAVAAEAGFTRSSRSANTSPAKKTQDAGSLVRNSIRGK